MPAINTTSQKHDNRSWIKYTNVFWGSRQPAIHDWSLSEHNVCMKVVSKKLVDFWKWLLTVCLQFHFYHFYNSPKIASFTFKQKIILHQITNKQKNHPVNSTIKNEDFFLCHGASCHELWFLSVHADLLCAPEEANIPWIKVDIYLLGSVRVTLASRVILSVFTYFTCTNADPHLCFLKVRWKHTEWSLSEDECFMIS